MSDGQGEVQRQIDADRARVDARNTDRLPQRFRWKHRTEQPWRFGVVFPSEFGGEKWWSIRTENGFADAADDPWETLGHVIGDAVAFEWLDNDYEWHPL